MKTVGRCHYLQLWCYAMVTLVRPAWD